MYYIHHDIELDSIEAPIYIYSMKWKLIKNKVIYMHVHINNKKPRSNRGGVNICIL